MKNVMIQNYHRKLLSYLLVQRVILFLAYYEYLTRINRNSKCFLNAVDSYEYDANGNMTMRNGVTITYDYDNRPTNICNSLVLSSPDVST